MVDIQQKLDEYLASHPQLQQYVSALYYVPAGQQPPEAATHVVDLSSASAAERRLRVAATCVPSFAAFLDMILAMVATQPPVKGAGL